MAPLHEFDDLQFQELEERLRSDAAQFVNSVPAFPVVSGIVAEYERRRCQAIRHRRAAIIAAVGLLFFVIGTFFAAPSFWNPAPSSSRNRSSLPIPEMTGSAMPVRQPADRSASTSILVGRNQNTLDSRPASGVVVTQPDDAAAVPKETAPPVYLPATLVATDEDGQPVMIPGVYVPARMRSVKLEELSPPMQRAVRMVLGLEDSVTGKGPI